MFQQRTGGEKKAEETSENSEHSEGNVIEGCFKMSWTLRVTAEGSLSICVALNMVRHIELLCLVYNTL